MKKRKKKRKKQYGRNCYINPFDVKKKTKII